MLKARRDSNDSENTALGSLYNNSYLVPRVNAIMKLIMPLSSSIICEKEMDDDIATVDRGYTDFVYLDYCSSLLAPNYSE